MLMLDVGQEKRDKLCGRTSPEDENAGTAVPLPMRVDIVLY